MVSSPPRPPPSHTLPLLSAIDLPIPQSGASWWLGGGRALVLPLVLGLAYALFGP